ncbi:phospho-N-acetylmuramoyl-pentapeptide-transferase [Lewinella marina]|uniref:Phospho-N-acetylmuramoyl-pentapeptide-transferase n=1 Tax=Neolewinella marina TaxID=438751 RepID=A0A2G0CIY4_9BACT|nr:phospho-N-acetylmuramoyl-pentapeptide-transferase [Neolewinella marina]NJB84905.1 phospho-N-acetylmuramoyl-pentapeptide-transferase [Neolewinella marina]PHK99942.1 phospho-N-acetylmuramoyl-pentapeptide-transferase [Neolewinella marina]
MLIELFEWLKATFGDFPGANLLDFLSVRTGSAIIVSLLLSIVTGGRIIRYLRRQQIGETVRDLGLEGQMEKKGTPTMGGLIILLAVLLPCLLFARLDNVYLLTMLVATIWMGAIGFVDDYLKIKRKNKDGLAGRFKVLGQIGLGLLIALIMLFNEQVVVRLTVAEAESVGIQDTQRVSPITTTSLRDGAVEERANYQTTLTNVPFLKNGVMTYADVFDIGRNLVWIIFVPLIVFIVTAVSNAANLTDGLDGLATGTSAIVAATLAVFAYVGSNAIAANYLGILHLPGTQELIVFSGCLVGACLGFLWHNSYPAAVFMGDTGSLALGGIIAALAILLRKELLIPILCGIFVIENVSVMAQVGYFKYTRMRYGEGRRILKMSPLHHHYQKGGMSEVKIVIRFWIIGILLAVATILTLKFR